MKSHDKSTENDSKMGWGRSWHNMFQCILKRGGRVIDRFKFTWKLWGWDLNMGWCFAKVSQVSALCISACHHSRCRYLNRVHHMVEYIQSRCVCLQSHSKLKAPLESGLNRLCCPSFHRVRAHSTCFPDFTYPSPCFLSFHFSVRTKYFYHFFLETQPPLTLEYNYFGGVHRGLLCMP